MLHIHRSNRTELLAEAMAEVFARAPLPPLRAEKIVVDGRGMERWLSLQLAARDGVFANPDFVFPRRMVLETLDAVLGPERQEAEALEARSCYEPEVLMWAVVGALPPLLEQDSFAPIRAYLDGAAPGSRRFVALAERIARTFDDYVVYRPDMVLSWQRGDMADAQLESRQRWQPELWRALVEHLGDQHMASRARAFEAALANDASPGPDYPSRLSLFGLSTVAPLYLRMLVGLQRHLDVHLYVLEPTRHYWADTVSERQAFARARREGRSEEELHLDLGHPLLAALGKQGRDYRIVLDGLGIEEAIEHEHFVDGAGGGVLQQLQADILDLDLERAPIPVDDDDRSISVHACHSPMREVEVLRDQLLAQFEADPGLLPGDVVVMTPAIDDYATCIDAVFGAAGEGARLRYSVADRGVRPTHALVDAFFKTLDTLRGRLSASEVLDLLACAPIRERFGLVQADVGRISTWVEQAGIRWAEDAAHRKATGHPEIGLNTWRFGLERLFVGMALPLEERALFHGVLPLDAVEGSSAELLGRLAELCSALFDFRQRLRGRASLVEWQQRLADLVQAFLHTPELEEHQSNMILDAVAKLCERAALAGYDEALDFEPLRAQLEDLLEAGRSSRGFLAGGITFCSTVPMRAIPFKVVCLLGMNDEAFPRSLRPPGFDLLGKRMVPGDRNVRDDDRYLFLEALLSARQKCIITYVGQSIRDNSRTPPSVVVSELLDVLASGFLPPGSEANAEPAKPEQRVALREQLVLAHPLQAFSPRYFGADPDSRLWSFSSQGSDVARALSSARTQRPAFVDGPLPVDDELARAITLDELLSFLKHPTRSYLRRGMGLYLEASAQDLPDTEPMELSALERWQVYDTMLEQLCQGLSAEQARATAQARGSLPYGVLGQAELEANMPAVQSLASKAGALRSGARLEELELALDLGGTRLTGVLRDVWPAGRIQVQYSRGSGHHLLELWLRHLALNCVAPEGYPRTSSLVARDSEGGAEVLTFGRVDDARQLLSQLVEIYVLGHRVPLPMFKRSSWRFAETLWQEPENQGKALEQARKSFAANPFGSVPGDGEDPYVAQVFAGLRPLEPGFCAVPLDGEEVPDFVELALRVYEPMLSSLQAGG